MDGKAEPSSSRTQDQREYRRLAPEFEQTLQQRNAYREEVHLLRKQCQSLESDLRYLRPKSYRERVSGSPIVGISDLAVDSC